MEMTEHERKRNSVRLCFINPLTTHRVAFPPFTVSAFLFHLTCALISCMSIRLKFIEQMQRFSLGDPYIDQNNLIRMHSSHP